MYICTEQADYLHLRELGGLELLSTLSPNTIFKAYHEGYCIGVIEEGAQSF